MTYEHIADRYLDVVLRGPTELMCKCPLCDGDASLQFNTEKGLWICFRCGQGGTAKRLVKLIGGTYADPEVSVQVLQTALDNLQNPKKSQQSKKVFNENWLLRFEGDSPDGYWANRGFTKASQQKWGLGYDPLSNKATIAYRNSSGELLGIIYRRLDNEFPRYLYPKGFDRGGSIYGSWEIMHSRSHAIAIVEGSTDCIWLDQCGWTAGAQYGSSITKRQVQLLRKLGIKSVTLFYDYDEAGRKAEEQAVKMLSGFFLYRVKWDAGKYCWHKKLCGCGKHGWKTIAQCREKLLCQCGRKHDMDPKQLTNYEIGMYLLNAELIGRKEEKCI